MTDNNQQPEPVPYPGEQFPAAILPQSDFPQAFPQSEPFPAVNQPVNQPMSQPYGPPPPLPVPRKPRNKAVIILSVLAVLFFLSAGALGTLWLVEQGDHKGTSSELQTVRDDLTNTQKQLKDTDDARAKATADKQRAERDAEHSKPCLDAAKAVIRAATENEAKKQFEAMVNNC